MDLQQAMITGLEVHQQTRCAYRLNDNTEFSGPWAEAVPWIEEVWLPRVCETGLKYLAHIARPGSFGETAGEVLSIGKAASFLEIRLFTNRKDALQWLQAKQLSNTQ